VFAENLFDHQVERFGMLSLCIPDQAAQALKILRGIAQAIDVVEPQALQPAFRDQLFYQAMDGVERAESSTRNPASVLISKNRR
jgi:hypothetical protein